ncbi:class I SAM-dependent methyltransferase [Candidatus Beckwithbacteria bacterium]|nr:class I SAM-dependent methyltransferase [Candidatus Beckwithbacteria bacterium]
MKQSHIWESTKYYEVAARSSQYLAHPGLKKIKELAQKADRVLEFGCGEGTKLSKIVPKTVKGTGIDISRTAIAMAKERHPAYDFVFYDGKKIPCKDGSFDLVYSAFVLEHLQNPSQNIKEMIRVLEKDGLLVLLAPNYGAPQRCSPCFKGHRIAKLIDGLIKDLIGSKGQLDWQKVSMKADTKHYQIDWDTTVEPYLGSLLSFLKTQNMKIIEYSSNWKIAEPQEQFVNKAFRFLGMRQLYPFKLWGPHLFVIACKL